MPTRRSILEHPRRPRGLPPQDMNHPQSTDALRAHGLTSREGA